MIHEHHLANLLELHAREVQIVYHGNNSELEHLLGSKGPFWGRQYFFWHNGKPLTLIYEVFSSSLEKFLGPADLISDT